jgi:hypothetical protein
MMMIVMMTIPPIDFQPEASQGFFRLERLDKYKQQHEGPVQPKKRKEKGIQHSNNILPMRQMKTAQHV